MSSSSTTSASAPATPAKRACDSCHRRKVKCLPVSSDVKRCRNCVSAGLDCTYFNKVQKKGPKGSRAKVLSEIRETQKQISPRPFGDHGNLSRSRSASPSFDPTPGLLNDELVNACVKFFFEGMYQSQPILHLPGVLQSMQARHHSIEHYCQIAALCGYVLLQPQSILPHALQIIVEFGRRSNRSYARRLLDEAIRVRKGIDWTDSPTIQTIYTSYFLSRAQHHLDRQDSAWIYLREAATVADILGLQHEETYCTGDVLDAYTKRKLYWTIFVVERVFAIQQHRPVSLRQTTRLPHAHEEAEILGQGDITGFIQILRLYRVFDDHFFDLWNRTRDDVSPGLIDHLETQLNSSASLYINTPPVYAVAFVVSRNWLRLVVWQLSLLQTISPLALDGTRTYSLLIEISRELIEQCDSACITQGAMEVHGLCLAEKMFDIACALADHIAIMPPNLALEAKAYLQRLFHIITTLSTAQERLVPQLHNKIIHLFPVTSIPGFQETQQNLMIDESFSHMYNMGMASHSPNISGISTSVGDLGSQGDIYGSMMSHPSPSNFSAYSTHTPVTRSPNSHWSPYQP